MYQIIFYFGLSYVKILGFNHCQPLCVLSHIKFICLYIKILSLAKHPIYFFSLLKSLKITEYFFPSKVRVLHILSATVRLACLSCLNGNAWLNELHSVNEGTSSFSGQMGYTFSPALERHYLVKKKLL